jgi:uncharacterized membrane protein YjgN (DUF898 family)
MFGRHSRIEADMTDLAAPTPVSVPHHPPEQLRFAYVPRKGLLKITIVSFLLSIITLGIYRFWAKTRVRQHIWSCVQINGEPLEYTGRGMELFVGFLIVFLTLILPPALLIAGVTAWYGPGSPEAAVVQVAVISIFYLAFFLFWGFAIYRSRAYQLSRTNWRGIRGALTGSAMIYSLLYFGSLLAKSFSLGWATPVMNTVLQEQISNDMRFGDAAFKFKGRAGPLYGTYALCWFLTFAAIIIAFVLFAGAGGGLFGGNVDAAFDSVFEDGGTPSDWEYGIVFLVIIGFFVFLVLFSLLIPMLWAVYTAKELRTFANYTRFDGAQFHLDATAGSVIWLTIVNILILIFTLGIGWPFINQRVVRFVVDRLRLEGAIDIDRIRQSQAARPKRGEGLADAFDVGGL